MVTPTGESQADHLGEKTILRQSMTKLSKLTV